MMGGKLAGLQVARAFAALGIAYFHSWHVTMPFPTGTAHPIEVLRDYGWLAVDFFFAISGFVICLATTSPKFRAGSFLIRRAFRLYPLWIATSCVFFYLTRYLGRSPEQTPGFFLYCLTLLPTNGFPFYDLGWSLQHEMAFYLLASLLVPLTGIYGLAAVLLLGVIVDHVFSLPWYLHQYFSYYGNFLAGVAAYLVHRRGLRFGVVLPIIMGLLFIRFASDRALFPIGLFFCLLGFVCMDRVPRLGVLLGDASYSVYLIHPLVFYSVYINLQPPLPPVWIQEPLRFGSLTLICIVAIASWKLFESPMIRLGEVVARKLTAEKLNHARI
jgi:peptidoglycan/LPS O-acetylase OafA/YrhL